jgi:hypothetical protein
MIKTDGRVWAVATAISLRGKSIEFLTHFSLHDMAEDFSQRMSLLPQYSVSHPVDVTGQSREQR